MDCLTDRDDPEDMGEEDPTIVKQNLQDVLAEKFPEMQELSIPIYAISALNVLKNRSKGSEGVLNS